MTSLSPELLEPFLKLPNTKITAIEIINAEIDIHVCAIEEKTHCHKCEKETDKYYGLGQEIKLRHL